MVFLRHIFGLMMHPDRTWEAISREQASIPKVMAHMVLMALIPAVAWFYGVTQIGWRVGGGEGTRITVDSMLIIIVLFYLGMLAALIGVGLLIHWMSVTYGAASTPARAISLATFTATPLFLGGVLGFYPVLWLDLLVGTAAGCYAVLLLYLGIPHMMGVPRERGYLFASATLAVGLVMVVTMMTATVLLWEFGAMPVFTD